MRLEVGAVAQIVDADLAGAVGGEAPAHVRIGHEGGAEALAGVGELGVVDRPWLQSR